MSKPCPYCGKKPDLVYGYELFPHLPKLAQKAFWRCKPCGAHVGCHNGTHKAFGPLANAELRKARTEAHAAFDPLWELRYMERTQAYEWLAEMLGIEVSKTHIGMFDLEQCMLTRSIAKEKLQELLMS